MFNSQLSFVIQIQGVGEGVRTLGHWSHNPALYQLSYAHQKRASASAIARSIKIKGGMTVAPTSLHQLGHDLPEIVFAWLGSFLGKRRQRSLGHIQKSHEVRFLFINIDQTR
jgi:hypothetical protein